jgi:excisionase family DNA binding protein
MSLPHLIDAAEVATALGLSKWRVYELAREGVIPHVRIGRSMRFDEAKVREWIEAGGSRGDE